MKNTLPSNTEPKSACRYNHGVQCATPIQQRTCGVCGWKQSVSRKRLEKIREKRQEELRNGKA